MNTAHQPPTCRARGRAVVRLKGSAPVGLVCCLYLLPEEVVQYDHKVGGGGRDALEGQGPQRQPHKRLDKRLEVAKAVGGGYSSVTYAIEAGTCPQGLF